jgi:AcrR family transcriptional regulator
MRRTGTNKSLAARADAAFRQNSTIDRFLPRPSSVDCSVSSVIQPADSAAASTGPAARPLLKGQQTRAAILDAALGLASQIGLEGLSIGALAEVTGMSKSGVFAHFGSREELQISVVTEYHAKFEDEVFVPAMQAERGLPRLRALFDRWVRRVSVEIDAGCIYISGAVEFDDRPGPVRDALVTMVETWHRALGRAIRAASAKAICAPTPTSSSCCSRSTD